MSLDVGSNPGVTPKLDGKLDMAGENNGTL